MNSKEIRYAIIIGINDYSQNPLSYCVNDAIEFKEVLINNCRFDENNIFMITSDTKTSEKDITGKYLEALREIKERFISKEDSILFYFAGHGSCKNNKSVVWLQESSYPIENIFNDISSLNPKVQMYIIDSCQSGSKVLTRNKDTELQQYIRSAKGTMFLYACQNTESAQELNELEHGLLTYKILESIKNKELYDDKGYLSFNRIVDYVQRETSVESGFEQIPVIENNIVGFYPFAVDKEKVVNNRNSDKTNIISENDIKTLKEIRTSLMDKGIKKLNESLECLEFDGYEVVTINDFDELDYIGVECLKEEIVEYVEKEKLIPLHNLIYKMEDEKKYDNPLFGNILKQVDLLNNVQNKITRYYINFGMEDLKANLKLFLSKTINEVSFGVGYIYYQAKWGVVALKIGFLIDWDGEVYNLIKDINIDDIALSLETTSIKLIDDINIGFEDFIKELVSSWNYDREEELNRYRRF